MIGPRGDGGQMLALGSVCLAPPFPQRVEKYKTRAGQAGGGELALVPGQECAQCAWSPILEMLNRCLTQLLLTSQEVKMVTLVDKVSSPSPTHWTMGEFGKVGRRGEIFLAGEQYKQSLRRGSLDGKIRGW